MYAYGPVPSRRLGRSIGVSPIPPKTCSYSCVYCQLGRTYNFQIKRESFFPKEDIWNDIKKVAAGEVADIITIVGDGEPTLNKDLGWIIDKIKSELDLPVAVITNGSLLHLKDVQKDLMNADIVLPSFDAASADLFKKIDRHHKNLNFDTVKKGIIEFSHKFSGQIWAQVMLVKDLNDDQESLIAINKYLKEARVDRVYITTPVRPPAENWAVPPEPSKIIEVGLIMLRMLFMSFHRGIHFEKNRLWILRNILMNWVLFRS